MPTSFFLDMRMMVSNALACHVSPLNCICVQVVSVRNVGNFKDTEMTFSEFVDYSRSASPYSAEGALLLRGSNVDRGSMCRG